MEGERLDYYVISGKTPMRTVEKYTELTGKTGTAAGMVVRIVVDDFFYYDYDEATTSGFIHGHGDREIPLHVFL